MNDLIDLREGWGQPEPPSPEAYLAARSALLEQASVARTATTAATVMREPTRLAIAGHHERPFREAKGRRRAGWLAAAAALTAAAAVAVATVLAGGPTAAPTAGGTGLHRAGITQNSARQILLDAALKAAAAPTRTGKYWYLKTQLPAPVPHGNWYTRGTVSWYTRDGAEYTLDPNGGEAVVPDQTGAFKLGAQPLSYRQIEQLPTSPAALKAWITRACLRRPTPLPVVAGFPPAPEPRWRPVPASEIPGDVAWSLSSLLGEIPAPPAVRAAAFRALALMPTVRKLGYADGGVVLAISMPPVPASKFPSGKAPRDTGVIKLIIDPATLMLRGEINYEGTTLILAAHWTNHMPRVIPFSRPSRQG